MSLLRTEGGSDAPLHPFEVTLRGVCSDEEICANIAATLDRGYEPFRVREPHDGVLSICGNAPSLADTWTAIRGDVWACNGASRFLAERGVRWTGFYWDPQPLVAEVVVHVAEGADYIVASQCHPSVFERLEGRSVTVWHPFSHGARRLLYERGVRTEPLIAGGCSAVTRAVFVAHTAGYRNIHLHGADSSYRDDKVHAQQQQNDAKLKRIGIECLGRSFVTSPAFAAQAQDFIAVLDKFPDLNFTVHGDGLIPHIARMLGVHAMNMKEP